MICANKINFLTIFNFVFQVSKTGGLGERREGHNGGLEVQQELHHSTTKISDSVPKEIDVKKVSFTNQWKSHEINCLGRAEVQTNTIVFNIIIFSLLRIFVPIILKFNCLCIHYSWSKHVFCLIKLEFQFPWGMKNVISQVSV